jgi:class 3 adenylate cyclase
MECISSETDSNNIIQKRQNSIDKLYLNFDSAHHIKLHKNTCICLIDIVNYSKWCSKHSPLEIFHTMTAYNDFICVILSKYGEDIHKIELVGDSILIIAGLTNNLPIYINCFNTICIAKNILSKVHFIQNLFDSYTSLRIGIHVGEISSGFITNPHKFQVFGNNINITSRLESITLPGTCCISSSSLTNLNSNTFKDSFIGKEQISLLKGVGIIKYHVCFTFNKDVLIADDNDTTITMYQNVLKSKFNLQSIRSNTIEQTVNLMKSYIYTYCILDIHFYLNEEQEHIIDYIKSFREWEGIYRNTRQKIILTSTDYDVSNLELIDGYIDKSNMFNLQHYNNVGIF